MEKTILDEALQMAQAGISLKQAYVPNLAAALPATKVVPSLQIGNKIRGSISPNPKTIEPP